MDAPVIIMIVEDEPLIREFLETTLQDGGYRVAAVASGQEAIQLLDARDADYRALVTDVNLESGKLTGWDVARHAREMIEGIPVVYVTGGSAHDWSVLGVPNSILITKPFAAAQLLTAVSQLLNDCAPPP
jgi:DNA-binding response OmpR family regulator